MIQYQEVQRSLALETAKRKDLEKKLGSCEDREVKLREDLKQKPVAKKIDPAQLEEIKKQALQEATKKLKQGSRQGEQAAPTPIKNFK